MVALGGALGAVVLSLDRIASEANLIEEKLTVRSAEAAVQSYLRHLGETHSDYAVWDEAVRNMYGTIDQAFVDENFVASTTTATFFETVYLLDEDGRDLFGFRAGEKIAASSAQAFGKALAVMAAKVPTDGHTRGVETGIVQTPWGLEAVAIGPVVPNTAAMSDPPKRARLLIFAKALDSAAVQRLDEDYVIPDLHLADATGTAGIPLSDPTGTVVGRLVWAAPKLGTDARAEVGPMVFLMFGLLIVGVGGLSLLAVRSLRRGDLLADESLMQHKRLEGALISVPHGICMFDGQKRLVFCNARYAEMYKLPTYLTTPGTSLQSIFDYRVSVGNAPADFPNYVSHLGIEWTTGGTKVFQFELQDGRIVRVSHLNMEGGSYIASHEDMTEVVRAESRLTHVARHDVLTNLPNRMGFRENLGEALRLAPAGSRLAVLCLDLDHFKGVNDTLGHPMGDALLVMVADRLRGVIGKNDLIARLGGDGFAIVQIGTEQPEGARRLAQAAMDSLGQPYDLRGSHVVVEASIGIALAPDHGSDADQLLKSAEMAQYWVKAHGRRIYQFFDPAMNIAAQSHHQIAAGLRGALEREELEVHYQPIVNLGTNTVTGFEALLRWHHPELGYVSPAKFIPVAEETGLIVSIGEWVLRRACADAAHWPRNLHVAVNLSSVQFKDQHLVTTVFSALSAAQLPAGRLELEITESVLLKDNQSTVETLHQLRDFGVNISMDDFGTGYSSLSYLRSFPFDKIKIDQSFVRDIVESAESRAIVRAVIGLGVEFGLVTTAEGVETPEQLAILRAAGCTEVQGFYFSEARPVAELAEFFVDPRTPGAIAA